MDSPKLGQILSGAGHQRDAVHVAIAPVQAGERLQPGQHVGCVRGEIAVSCISPIGVVDPFLTHPVNPGEWFWLLLYPGTVGSLRHQWEHPAFGTPEITHKNDSEQWLQRFAQEAAIPYAEMLEAAQDYVDFGTTLTDPRWNDWHVPEEFWDHYEIAAKTTVSPADRGSFFPDSSCSGC